MDIRPETPQDYAEIYDFVKTAFQTAQVSSGSEQDFVNSLRQSKNYIPELALVMHEDGRLVGHIMLTRTIVKDDTRTHETLLLGPVSIDLAYRNRGLGSELICEALNRAKALSHRSVVLVGNPVYYRRFGFRSTTEFGINPPDGIPSQYVMALELVPNGLHGVQGIPKCC